MDKPGRMLHLWNGKIKVERRLIPTYFTDYYKSALELYLRFKRYGLPFGGGYEEQPGWYIEMLDVFQNVEQIQPIGKANGDDSRRTTGSHRREGAGRNPRPSKS